MSKKVSAGEFLHQFASLEKKLRPGESVTVTRRGAPIGEFIKRPAKPKIKMPDFKKDACRLGYGVEVGDRVLARLLSDDEAIC